jgi:hypothetical protein
MDTAEALTLAVAAYAALVATLVAAFQAVSARTRMKVVPMWMELHTPGPAEVPGPPPEEVVLVTMTNHSDHPVKVTHLSFAPSRGKRWFFVYRPYPVEEPLPIAIESRDSKMVWTLPDRLEGALDLDGRVRVRVSTSNGKTFNSGRVYLEPAKHWNWRRPWRRRELPDNT